MRISRTRLFHSILACAFACIVFLAPPASGAASDPRAFLAARNAPAELISRMLDSDAPFRSCAAGGGMLICGQGREYAGIAGNALAKNATLKSLGLLVSNDLDQALVERTGSTGFRNRQAVGETVSKVRNAGRITLKGMESMTYCRGNWCGAIAAVPLAEAGEYLPRLYGTPEFVRSYCDTLLPKARRQMGEGNYQEALESLKELHDLKYADVEAYLLAVQAFIHENEPDEGAKIAREILSDLGDRLDASQAESLGDCFLELHMDADAEKAYSLASRLLTGE